MRQTGDPMVHFSNRLLADLKIACFKAAYSLFWTMILLEEIIDKENSFELVNAATSQIATINLPNTLKIEITVPNDVFEWYVDVYNSDGIMLTSNWYDHYDDKKENLMIEMRDSIAEFIHAVTKNDSRIVAKQNSSGSIFQILIDNKWIDYI